DPFRFPAGAADEWFADADVSDRVVALTRKLLYRRGGSDCFSDYDIVLQQLPIAERRSYVKMLSRVSALMVQLRLQRGADVDALVRYWGASNRRKDLAPLLHSLALRPQGGALDIVHLLPGFARRLL